MAQDTVNGQILDDRFEYPVIDGPSWERLCDGLKYQGNRDYVEVKFTYLESDVKKTLEGKVQGIVGQGTDPSTCPIVYFQRQFTLPPQGFWILKYWPNRRGGHAINSARRDQFTL